MRLVGVSLVAMLVFALVAMLVQNNDLGLSLNKEPSAIDQPINHLLELGDAPLEPETVGPAGTAEFPILQYDSWTSVAGFSSNEQFTMVLPRATSFDHAVVNLDVTSHLENSATGHLRVSINGKRRGEIILNSGDYKHQIRVPLEPLDMIKDWVDVNLVVVGNNPKAECTAEWNGGAIVSVLPTSKTTVTLNEPVDDYGDLLLLSGSPVRMIWKNELTDTSLRSRARMAWSWPIIAMSAVFVDPRVAREATDVPFSLDELFAVRNHKFEKIRMQSELVAAAGVNWPISLVSNISDARMREFRNRANWVLRYNIADMPDNHLPDLFHLDMSAMASDQNIDWLLLVLLNDTIVHSEVLTGEAQDIQRDIALPYELGLAENELRIVLTSDEEKKGHCTAGSAAAAQLRQNTALLSGSKALGMEYAEIQALTGANIDISIGEFVSANQGNDAFNTLGNIFETNNYRYVDGVVAKADPTRGYVKVLADTSLAGTLAKLGTREDQVWFGFSILNEDGHREVLTFKGDDPLFPKAVELYQPNSLLLIAAPGFEL